jgi:parallel beta-helix repeat protein
LKRKCLAVGIILLFIGTAIIPSSGQKIENLSFPSSRSHWLYVGGSGPGNYTKIQDAIEDAQDGDTIFVYHDSSPYCETLHIDVSIHLLGENKTSTLIDGNSNDSTILVTADDVQISGFTIQYGGQSYPNAVISLNGSDFSEISQSIIQDSQLDGILLKDSTYVRISENIIQQNHEFGIDLIEASTNNITIAFNTIAYNYGGVVGFDTDNILVYSNSVVYNEMAGVFFHYSRNVRGYYNDVINKGTNGFDSSPLDHWENETSLVGNYWGDYKGVDANGDGIGDTPYTFDFNTDNFPLMKPVHELYVDGRGPYLCALYDVVPFKAEVHGGHAPFEWLWEFGDGTSSTQQSPTHQYQTPGIHHALVTVTDAVGKSSFNIVTVKVSYITDATMYVDDDYNALTPGWDVDHFSNIQDGIDLCGLQGRVEVNTGFYGDSGHKRSVFIYAGPDMVDHPYLTVMKPLTLNGAGKKAVIDGGDAGYAVDISADDVTMTGFTIQNFGSWGAHCSGDNCIFSYNRIIGDERCIVVRGNHIKIYGNELTSGYENDVLEIVGCVDIDIYRNNITNSYSPFDLIVNEQVKIHENNLMKNIIRTGYWADLLTTVLSPSKRTRFYHNYWYRPRVLPKLIIGLGFLNSSVPVPVPVFQFDLFPAKQPYDISGV